MYFLTVAFSQFIHAGMHLAEVQVEVNEFNEILTNIVT